MGTNTDQIVLLDLASQKPCRPWLRHSIKVHLILKFKQVHYTTDWIEYPEIEGKIKPHLPPNKSGLAYTIPTIKLADDTWMTDSYAIVEALERLHPSPPLHLNGPYRAKVDDLAAKVMQKISPNCYSRIPHNILNDASREYWYRTRQQRLGISVDEYEARSGGDAAYADAGPYLKQLTQLLEENEGPYFMGKDVSCADFSWAAFLVFFRCVDEEVFTKVLDASGNQAIHLALLKACDPWLDGE